MAGNIIDQWFAAASVEENYQTMHVWDGDGNAARVFELNFQGGYINQADVKAFMVNKTTQERTDLTVKFTGTNTVTLSQAVPTTHQVTIYRDTNKSSPLASFADGAIITAINLDRNAKQAVFAVAEMVDRFDSVTATAQDAIATAYTALDKANTAINTADGAVVTANAASSAAAGAVSDARNAVSTANAATDTANSAKATAEGIDAKVNEAVSTANDANSTANAANATANGIDAKATTAMTDAAKAKTDAATALSTAKGIDAKATQAQADAKSAKSTAEAASTTANGIDAKASDALAKAKDASTTADAAMSSVNTFMAAVDSATATAVSFKGRLYANGNGGGMFLYGDTSNYLAFTKADKSTRRALIGFAGTDSLISMVNDTVGINETGFKFSNGIHSTSRVGGGGFASQFDTDAPFMHSYTSAAASEWNPVLKQLARSTAYPGGASVTYSLGTLVSSSDLPSFGIYMRGGNGTDYRWSFNADGTTTLPATLGVGNARVNPDGNVYGSVWGNSTVYEFVMKRFVTQVRIVSITTAKLYRGAGISAGSGRVITGINNTNSDDYIDSCTYGNLQYIINGTAYNVY